MENASVYESFAATVAGWNAFYQAVAGSAATLIGLVFVALSLNPAVLTKSGSSGVREWAGQTFSSFIALLSIALVFLIPDPTPFFLGTSLVVVGVQGLIRGVSRLRRIRYDPNPAWRGRRAVWRFAAPATAELIAIAVGVDVYRGNGDSLGWLVAFVFLLVSSAVGSC